MKKNIKTILILLLTLTLLASIVVVAACKETTTVTLTVDYNLPDVENSTFIVDVGKPFADKLTRPASDYIFGGWYLSDGSEVTNSTVAPGTDFTVKAKWNATYRVEYYLEKLDADGEYDLSTDLTTDSYTELGSNISAEVKTVRGFTFDENNVNNVKSATLSSNGTTLKLYYKRNTVTITFDKLVNSATGSMQPITGKYGARVKLTVNGFSSGFEFVGWNTASDGTGAKYSDGANYTLNDNVTLYAQWQTGYTVIVYVEKDITSTTEAEYDEQTQIAKTGIIGNTVTATASNPNAKKYDLDTTLSKTSGVVSEEGLQLNIYFSLHLFTIRYMDDNTVEYAKYGSNYTVRTPANNDDSVIILSYSNSPTGNGTEYAFGAEIKNVKADMTLYPVASNIYYDDAESGDRVEIRNNMSGYGSAVLIRNGERHEGRATKVDGYASFEVEINGVTEHGRLMDGNLFRYRGDEYGAYLFYDYVLDYVDPLSMIMFDGYGSGVIAAYANDGTDRVINYYLLYEYDEEMNDYYVLFGLPGTSVEQWAYTYFRIVKGTFEGEQYADIAGYFMENNYYNESYEWVLYENQEIYRVYMSLDGYGKAVVFGTDGDDDVIWSVTGTYNGSKYFSKDNPEFMFYSDNESIYPSCYFILWSLSYGGQTLYVFTPKNAEYGTYTTAGSTAELYLDGYGGASYFANSEDDGRVGSYTIKDNQDGTYTVIIRFTDGIGGSMVVTITMDRIDQSTGMTVGSFTLYEGGFILDATKTVLEQYVYDEDVGPESVIRIPDGVKEIAANVFNGINITSVTFPASLEKIGDYAFSNGNASGGSTLRFVIFLGSTPPTLGADVFRWIKGSNFYIVVPDGAADAYRNAPSWLTSDSQKEGGYAQFVTTQAELDDKPLYEVKNGVLVSYNNTQPDPQNVQIIIPDDVTEIAAGVFTNLTYITSVDLKNVKIIGANAFYGCTGITAITFNPEMESIGDRAFYNCVNISSVDLGEIKYIGAEAFSRCLKLATVNIGNSITYIGDYAFYECSRTEDYGYDTAGELIENVEQFDLIIEIAATTAPTMGVYIFQGSQPRLFVKDYETAIVYADATTWSTYIKHVRVHAQGDKQTWYSKSNNNGWRLVLDDRLTFDDNYIGWYKWENATTLKVTWLVYSEIADRVSLHAQTATVNTQGELIGLDLIWDEGVAYTFVQTGTILEYTSDGGDTLQITLTENEDGKLSGKFNNQAIQIYMVTYRMRFEYNGYIYEVTLYNDSNQLTFSYTRTKIIVVKKYNATDGSTLEVFYGDSINANGRLKDVGDKHVEIYTETKSWYLIEQSTNVYTFRWNHATGNYLVVITITGEDTFEYSWSIYSTVTIYRDTEHGHVAMVTVSNTGEVSIRFLFKTANGTEQQDAEILGRTGDNIFTIEINGMTDVESADGDVYQVPSTFNGTYTLTLYPDATNPMFELVEIN